MTEEYPRCQSNEGKEVVSENYAIVYGDRYLQRRFADGSGELVRFDDNAGMWAVLAFPAEVEDGIEDKIRTVVRHNFDIGVCLHRQNERAEAA